MPWATLAAVLAVVALGLAPPSWTDALALQRDAVLARPWQMWTASLVHFGPVHLAADAAGLALAGALAERRLGPRRWLAGWAVGAPLQALVVLLAQPAVQAYRGASGMVVMLAALLLAQAWAARTLPRAALAAAVAAWAGMAAWGAFTLAPSAVLPAGVQVAWAAHAAGALLGVAWAGWLGRRERRG